jgi:hypothetical protein
MLLKQICTLILPIKIDVKTSLSANKEKIEEIIKRFTARQEVIDKYKFNFSGAKQ